jgi:phosphoribosylanthranilate isomerase
VTKLFVKICGITRTQDAELASALGATAVGFVFWPGSPRYITPDAARCIAAQVPAQVKTVGVFVDEPLEHVVRIAQEVGLGAVQLHGHETPEYCQELMVRLSEVAHSIPASSGATDLTVIKAVGMSDNGVVRIADLEPNALLLIDAHDPTRYGGTGRTVNWEVAREIAGMRPAILSGGLNAANVGLAIRSVRPYGIDVSSGVESAPGVKDPSRLRSLFEALHD